MSSATIIDAAELTAELLASTRALAVTDGAVALVLWKHPNWPSGHHSPALLVRVADLTAVAPIRAQIIKLGFGEGLVPPSLLGV